MNRVTARMITRNLTMIKDHIQTDSFDRIVDWLVENEVLRLNVKDDIASKQTLSEKIDFLLHRVTRQGPTACAMLVAAMDTNGLSAEAETIRATEEKHSTPLTARSRTGVKGTKRTNRDEMPYPIQESSSTHTAQNHVPRLNLMDVQGNTNAASIRHQDFNLEDTFQEMMVQNATFREDMRRDMEREKEEIRTERRKSKKESEKQRKDMETQFKDQRDDIRREKEDLHKEKEQIRKERRKMRKENEDLHTANRELNDKVIALEKEFRNYRDKSDRKIARKDTEIAKLRTLNDQLRTDLDNLKLRVCAENDLHQDQTHQIIEEVDERAARINNLEQMCISESASARDQTARGRQFSQAVPLPPIDEAGNRKPRSRSSRRSNSSSQENWRSPKITYPYN